MNNIEDFLLNFLILSQIYNDDFWEPVKVSLSTEQISKLKIHNFSDECSICCECQSNFNIPDCCKNKICTLCVKKWFDKSVYCPYCKQDLRDYIT